MFQSSLSVLAEERKEKMEPNFTLTLDLFDLKKKNSFWRVGNEWLKGDDGGGSNRKTNALKCTTIAAE